MKYLALLAFTCMSLVQAEEFCYERKYTEKDLSSSATQVLKSIQIKITEPNGDSTPSMTEDGLVGEHGILINGITRNGKTYVYYDIGGALSFKTAKGISRAATEESPFGSIDFDYFQTKEQLKSPWLAPYKAGTLVYQLKVTNDLTLMEKDTFCNDGLECVDTLELKAKDKVNNIYRLAEVPCKGLNFVRHAVKKSPAQKPNGMEFSIAYKGKMYFKLIKNKKLDAAQRQRLNIPANVDFTWHRYYELSQVDLTINGQATGLQNVKPEDANAFAFDPKRTDVAAVVIPSAETLQELAQEIPLNTNDVKWDTKGNLLSVDMVGPMRASGFLGSTASAEMTVDGNSIGGAVTVNNFLCKADPSLTKLVCDVDYVTSMSIGTN